MSEIETSFCVINVMNGDPVLKIEMKPWVESSMLRKVNNGEYICS